MSKKTIMIWEMVSGLKNMNTMKRNLVILGKII